MRADEAEQRAAAAEAEVSAALRDRDAAFARAEAAEAARAAHAGRRPATAPTGGPPAPGGGTSGDVAAAAAQARAELHAERLRRVDAEAALGHTTERARKAEAEAAELLGRLQAHLEGMRRSSTMLGNGAAEAESAAVRRMHDSVQTTLARLQEQCRERQADADAARSQLRRTQAEAADRQRRDGAEIQRLAAALSNLKGGHAAIAAATVATGARAAPPAGAADSTLRAALEARTAEAEVARNRAAQAEAKLGLVEGRLSEELRQGKADLEAARRELERERVRGPSKVTEALVARLKAQLQSKDGRLEQLREAIKTLEQKLVGALQQGADSVLGESSLKLGQATSARLEDMLTAAQARGQKLDARLAKCREELARTKDGAAKLRAAQGKASEELARERSRRAQLAADLAQEQRRVRQLRDKAAGGVQGGAKVRAAMAGATARADESKVGRLERRVKVLEAQNARLRSLMQMEEAPPVERDVSAGVAAAAAKAAAVVAEATDKRMAGWALELTAPPGASTALAEGDARGAPKGETARKKKEEGGAKSDQALAQWEEGKRLQRQVDAARARATKAHEKLAGVQAEVDKHKKAAAQAQSETSRMAMRVRNLETQLADMKAAGKGKPPPKGKAAPRAREMPDAEALKSLAAQLAAAEAKRDALVQETQRLKRAAGGGVGEASPGAEEAFDLRLQRDQALAQVHRLEHRLTALFGEEAAGGGTYATGAKSGRKGKKEEELEAVVAALQRTVEKLKREVEQSVSSQKYMAAVQKGRELKHRVQNLEDEAEKAGRLAVQVKDLERRSKQLEAANAALKKKLGGIAVLERRLEDLTSVLAEKDLSLDQLSQQLESREDEFTSYLTVAAAEDFPTRIKDLNAALAEAEAENRDLRNELNAFDPKFFEEIEDLKHEHHVFSLENAELKKEVARLGMTDR